jgi:hypothetical protein
MRCSVALEIEAVVQEAAGCDATLCHASISLGCNNSLRGECRQVQRSFGRIKMAPTIAIAIDKVVRVWSVTRYSLFDKANRYNHTCDGHTATSQASARIFPRQTDRAPRPTSAHRTIRIQDGYLKILSQISHSGLGNIIRHLQVFELTLRWQNAPPQSSLGISIRNLPTPLTP